MPANIIPACWTLFCIIWLLAAVFNKRSIYRESGAQRLRYSILLVLAFLLLTKRHRLPYPLDVQIIPTAAAGMDDRDSLHRGSRVLRLGESYSGAQLEWQHHPEGRTRVH
jgi:hypothetical protein